MRGDMIQECLDCWKRSGLDTSALDFDDAVSLLSKIKLQFDTYQDGQNRYLQHRIFVSEFHAKTTPNGRLVSLLIMVSSERIPDRSLITFFSWGVVFPFWLNREDIDPFYNAFMTWMNELQIKYASICKDIAARVFSDKEEA